MIENHREPRSGGGAVRAQMSREAQHHFIKDPARVPFDEILIFWHPVRGGADLLFPAPDTGAQEQEAEELLVLKTELLNVSVGDEHHPRGALCSPAQLTECDNAQDIRYEVCVRERNCTEEHPDLDYPDNHEVVS